MLRWTRGLAVAVYQVVYPQPGQVGVAGCGAQVVYHNLGLLVIDEEQRFGVRQKERISSLKTTVDLLTLSATPIPQHALHVPPRLPRRQPHRHAAP